MLRAVSRAGNRTAEAKPADIVLQAALNEIGEKAPDDVQWDLAFRVMQAWTAS